MKRYEATKKVSDIIIADGLIEALFLKGSIARGEDDDYSDVDLYAVVSEENHEAFLVKRIAYLEAYKPLINWAEVNFVGPQIVGIFEDALHFDLYCVKPDAIPATGEIKVIKDDKGLLNNYKPLPLALSTEELSRYMNEFTYLFVEIEAAYYRGDLLRIVSLFHMNYGVLGLLIRYVYDKDSSRLGNKGLYKVIPGKLHQELMEMLEYATPTKIKKALMMLLGHFENIIKALPSEVCEKINGKYYQVLSSRIKGLN